MNGLHQWRQRTFQALIHTDFRVYWYSQILSLLASWIQTTALSYLVLELTPSSQVLGWVNVVQFTPTLLFSLFAGALLDRISKKAVLQGTQVAFMLIAIASGVLIHTGLITLPLIFVMSALTGFANAFNMPARQSLLAEFVPRESLPNAVALNSLAFNTSRTIGQALFGLVVPLGVFMLAGGDEHAISRLAFPFYLNALTFLGVMFIQAQLHWKDPEPQIQQGMLGRIAEGLRYVKSSPKVKFIMLLIGVVSITVINFNILIPYFAKQVFHLKEAAFGGLSAAFGAGCMIGALWQASKPKPERNLRYAALALPVTNILFALSPNLMLGTVALVLCGFSMMSCLVSANSLIQLTIPHELRGRVMSLYTTVLVGSAPIGAALEGYAIAEDGLFGPHLGVVVLSAIGMLFIGWLLYAYRNALK
ncbi:MFS transporter [Deinococcus cellulosilyticus]|uniref:MFS transporter n=1 Tax=Deinococcus cellulosilyticus (strain DSM 18568 / NBRC 106333 / KACC 11606 / 5516J-15) TaxID=1223518 RepID=A0A511MX57_DEIC1|nr:MFS transporter [Deinococcus cellulosilyticus]GEM45164.1 MFS transporter [Deinococcus cellulosilyticus NBRC 106333 = KACC 11606]